MRKRWDGSNLLVWWAGIADSTGYAYTRETDGTSHDPTEVGNRTWARIAGLPRAHGLKLDRIRLRIDYGCVWMKRNTLINRPMMCHHGGTDPTAGSVSCQVIAISPKI